jgi:hypothetical protein
MLNSGSSLPNRKIGKGWDMGRWRDDPLEYSRKYAREWCRSRRRMVLEFYGGIPPRCKCCGESEVKFLSIDHINGGGRKHRDSIKGSVYSWIIKNDFPVGFQILCHNCNQARGYYGKCPHEEA